ncbi:gliding motility-associated C-terminal domain-containing protein [Vicingaceae bacterium]|nr:gliding motility-associated C-terminal domain-containing protein [Vicingaceae bacterium]
MNFGKYLLFSVLLSLFSISNAVAADFYWVGNTGNWNDASHWANNSGGNGGVGIPTQNDNVFFDANSFTILNQKVTSSIDISIDNLTISSNSSNFTITSSQPIKIDIYGSLDVSTTLNNEILGTLNFISNTTSIKPLNFGVNSWNTDINFNGKGTYILNSPIHSVNKTLSLISGELDLNENSIYCGSFNSVSNKKRSIKSNNASIYVYNQWITNPNKLTHDFSNTSIYSLNSNPNSINKNGDIFNIIQYSNSQNKVITSTSIITDTASCGDQCDGMIIVNFTTVCPTGATVSWNSSSNPDPLGDDNGAVAITTGSDTIFNVCPGIEYTATIIDDCDGNPAFPLPKATVLGHSRITTPINPSITEPSCNGICDGGILVFIDAAGWVISNNYLTYQWTPGGIADTSTSLTGMCAGTNYSIQASDGYGCDTTFTFQITEPDSLFANVSVTDPFCFNECSGSATSNPLGGTGPYSYLWTPTTSDPALDTVQTFGNLCDGTAYSVTVTDVNGCTNDTTIIPSEPLPLAIDTSSTRPSCGGDTDGSITVTVTGGGTGPFTHSWSTGFSETIAISISSSISNLGAGSYCDTIRDFNGCDTILCFTLSEPDTVLTSTTITNLTCNGICNGTATTFVTGGTQPYTYVWDSIPNAGGFTAFDSIVSLCPGTYFVTVSDVFLCSVSDTLVITEPTPLTLSIDSTNITCNGADNGTATANPAGGTPGTTGYTFVWTGPACNPTPGNTQTISSLCAGTYTVVVTDSLGCQETLSTTIIDPPLIVLAMSSENETCAGNCDGTATVNATGGTGNPSTFTYTWSPGNPNGQGTDSIFGLCPAVYTVTVTDANNCMNNNSVTIDPSTDIVPNLDTTDLTCNGVANGTATVSPIGTAPFTVEWDSPGAIFNIPLGGSNTITGLSAGPHTTTITDGNNCILVVNFTINEPLPLTISSATTDITCFGLCDGTATPTPGGGTAPYGNITLNPILGGPALTAPFNNLCAGTYYFIVEDDSSCTINDTIEIFAPNEILPNATFTNITCNGLNDGTATATPTGGNGTITSIVWTNLTTNTGLGAGPLSNLAPGQYEVVVTDGAGCEGKDTITITDPPALTVSADATGASCGTICDGTALATPNGGTPGTTGYTYSWNTLPTNQTTQTATGLCAGEFMVTVTDSMGCTAQDTTVINNLIIIGITTTAVGLSCNGVCDGTASVNASGGQAPYTIQWSGNSSNANDTLTSIDSLCPGMIYVTVTDANGCASMDSTLMPIAPPVLFPNAQIDQEISCAGLCDAMVSHNPTGGTAPYSSVWTLPNGVDTNNVCPTFAVVTVTDDNGCIQSDTLVINDPLPITPNDVVVNVQCFGDSTGSITLSPAGGTGGTYNYVWSGPMPGSGISTTGLMAGIYTITISDSNGCFIQVIDTINEPTILSSNPITSNISCNGICDGIMSVSVNGGVGPYSYSWQNSNPPTLSSNGDSLLNICPTPITNLSNTVTITDNNGCTVTQLVTITAPVLLDANVTGTGILCSNDCNGTAISNPTGGTAPYSILWSPYPAPADSVQITGLCIGNYLATVTDDNGCIDTMTYTVDAPLALNAILDSTNITCNGNNNGTITANITGGTLPYSITWTGPQTLPSDTNFINNLVPGVYTVTITDNNGCSFQGSIIIEEPQPITNTPTIVLANCGASDGSITMSPAGGSQPYTHSWSNGETTPFISNLTAGFYSDTITDFNGCVEIFTIGVSNPTGPSGVTPTVNDATCFGTCTGSLNVIVIGGSPTFNYTWSGPNGFTGTNDSTQNNLCAGTYNLQVEDANNCILTTSLLVGEADSITENSTFTDASCNGTCDGTASVTPTGGTAPYSYLWLSNGSTNSSISGLCAGTESVTITDFYGCQKTVDFTIGSPNALTVTSTNTPTTCNTDCDGTASANPTSGTSPYTYQWNDPASQTGQTATGLCDGTYIVTVTDLNGCSENDTVIIVEPTPISVTPITTNSTCGNSDGTADVSGSTGGTGTHTYNWPALSTTIPNPTGLAAGTYTVEITDANLCMQSFLVTISDANGPTVSVTPTNASCDGVCDGQATVTASGTASFSYLWQTGGQTTPTITGLCAGNYSVEVTDGNGCITTEPVTIIDNTAITATVSTIETTCNGDCNGSALVTPNGGTAPYSYSWTGGNAAGQTINAVGGLCAGNYTVIITDFIGCSITQDVVITEPSILSVSVSGIAANCNGSCDGQATATPSGGTAPFTYLWSNNATTPTITALCEGSYTVTITDFNGCTAQGNVAIGDGVDITATINSVDVTGSGATCATCDGSITVSNIAGGSGGPYTLLWSGNGLTTSTITDLCPGAYTLTITDNGGCTEEFTTLINNQNGQATLNTQANDVTCFGSCDGLAFTTPIGGLAPVLQYQWDDPNLTTNDSAITLCAGFYTVIMQDVLGCITVDTVSVLEPEEIISNFTFTEPTCPTICDGTITVNPTGGAGNYTFQWDGDATPGQLNTITGLCAGAHSVVITDADGCSITENITLTDPTQITITASGTQPTCFGDCDGTAIANASGGNPGYQYSWDTAPTQNNSLIGGLCAGSYTVTVTDNGGCTATETVQIIDPVVLGTTTVIDSSESCNASCDGGITTTPAGGQTPYTYLWSNNETTQSITNLCAGTYHVTITDDNNCTFRDTVTLTPPAILDAGIIPFEPDCGTPNGSILSLPTAGGQYNFVWTNTVNPNPVILTELNVSTSTVNGLSVGTYNLELSDLGTNCVTNYVIILNNIDGPTLALTSTDESCPTACDGTATVTPTGGTLPYTYSWIPAITPTNTNQTATDLCPDFYTVTVTDSNNCITSDTITINTIGLNLNVTNIVPETCFGDCDGSATVLVSGGTPNYNFSWNPTLQTTPQGSGLCVGSYVITVTDASNCKDSISTNITSPDLLTVIATENSPVSCNGLNDGAVIANVLGGNPNYQYSWNTNPIQTTQIATNLGAGTYIVIVTDDKGCTATDTVTLTESDPILDNHTPTLPACGVCDGSITVAPTGGSGNYSYSWTTPGSPPATPLLNTATIIDLCAGAYTLTIIDNTSGCSANFSYPLSNTNAPDPNTSAETASCNGICDGFVYSEPIGGVSPYSYLWNTGVPNTDSTITNLCEGQYEITVTDASGCIGVAIDSITQPETLQANLTATNINCNGNCDGTATAQPTGGTYPFTYTWTPTSSIDSNLTNLCAGTHITTITDNNGCSITDSVLIIEPTLISATSTQVDATCSSNCDGEAIITTSGGIGPYTFQWNGNTAPNQGNNQTGLCFGLNLIEIFDQNGCSIIDSVNIGATDTVEAFAGIDTNYCIGTPVNLNGTPSGTFTSVEWFELPSMTSLGNTNSITTTPSTTGPIQYVFQVNGACSDLDTVTILINSLPVVNAGEDVDIFEGASTQLNATGGISYTWTPTLGLSDSTISNPIASPTVTTIYFVNAIDANGCIGIDSIIVTVLPYIKFPDGISPNGDGANDVWIIDFIEQYPENVVEIYNRWGELLFHADGYEQDWDGTYNGKALPIGTYYYIIDLNDESIKPFTGPLTILR